MSYLHNHVICLLNLSVFIFNFAKMFCLHHNKTFKIPKVMGQGSLSMHNGTTSFLGESRSASAPAPRGTEGFYVILYIAPTLVFSC